MKTRFEAKSSPYSEQLQQPTTQRTNPEKRNIDTFIELRNKKAGSGTVESIPPQSYFTTISDQSRFWWPSWQA